jgi:hypothetical protein
MATGECPDSTLSEALAALLAAQPRHSRIAKDGSMLD